MAQPNLYSALSISVGIPPAASTTITKVDEETYDDDASTAGIGMPSSLVAFSRQVPGVDGLSTTHTRVDDETYDDDAHGLSLSVPAPIAETRYTATAETYDDDPNSGALGLLE